jgi:hypothetical protein
VVKDGVRDTLKGVVLFNFFEIYIVLRGTSGGRMALLGTGSGLLRLRLFLILPFPHPIAHVPELLAYMARRPEYGHQEVEHESVQQIENNDDK